MNMMKQAEVLTDLGTNELALMEFTICGEQFGINVTKVREIMKYQTITPMQNAHPAIEGIYKPRTEVITVIDLAKYLGLGISDDLERDIIMTTEFNSQAIAFHVHTVVGIARVSWKNIHKPDNIIYGESESAATGIVEYNGRLITILDFETIVADISPSTTINPNDLDSLGDRDRSMLPILIAEDSLMLSKLIVESLHRAGYVNTTKVDDGQQAFDYLQEAKEEGGAILDHVGCIISDIEMPQMDGHHLLKLIKEDSVLAKIPVILFSSIINDQLKLVGEALGAAAQISKPEIATLVNIVDTVTAEQQ